MTEVLDTHETAIRAATNSIRALANLALEQNDSRMLALLPHVGGMATSLIQYSEALSHALDSDTLANTEAPHLPPTAPDDTSAESTHDTAVEAGAQPDETPGDAEAATQESGQPEKTPDKKLGESDRILLVYLEEHVGEELAPGALATILPDTMTNAARKQAVTKFFRKLAENPEFAGRLTDNSRKTAAKRYTLLPASSEASESVADGSDIDADTPLIANGHDDSVESENLEGADSPRGSESGDVSTGIPETSSATTNAAQREASAAILAEARQREQDIALLGQYDINLSVNGAKHLSIRGIPLNLDHHAVDTLIAIARRDGRTTFQDLVIDPMLRDQKSADGAQLLMSSLEHIGALMKEHGIDWSNVTVPENGKTPRKIRLGDLEQTRKLATQNEGRRFLDQ